jgi:hypothetical protein
MKKNILITILALILLISIPVQHKTASAQETDEVGFLDALGKKSAASISDAQTLFKMVLEKKYTPSAAVEDKNSSVKKGYIAYLVAGNLGLTDSLLFNLSRSQRYAFRVCVAHKLMNADGSENDMMSGEELIEFLRLASEYKEKGATK